MRQSLMSTGWRNRAELGCYQKLFADKLYNPQNQMETAVVTNALAPLCSKKCSGGWANRKSSQMSQIIDRIYRIITMKPSDQSWRAKKMGKDVNKLVS